MQGPHCVITLNFSLFVWCCWYTGGSTLSDADCYKIAKIANCASYCDYDFHQWFWSQWLVIKIKEVWCAKNCYLRQEASVPAWAFLCDFHLWPKLQWLEYKISLKFETTQRKVFLAFINLQCRWKKFIVKLMWNRYWLRFSWMYVFFCNCISVPSFRGSCFMYLTCKILQNMFILIR